MEHLRDNLESGTRETFVLTRKTFANKFWIFNVILRMRALPRKLHSCKMEEGSFVKYLEDFASGETLCDDISAEHISFKMFPHLKTTGKKKHSTMIWWIQKKFFLSFKIFETFSFAFQVYPSFMFFLSFFPLSR